MRRSYRVALICGALPLLVGISIFLLWLLTRWDWLMLAGLFTLYGGLAIFLIGSISLGRFCWLAFRATELSQRRLWISTLGCAALLLSNFPAAVAIIATGIAIETRYTVVVHNASSEPVSDVQVFGGGCEANFGTIAPGETAERSFWIQRDGTLKMCAVIDSKTHTNVVDGYVTHNQGGHVKIRINSDGEISISNRFTRMAGH